MWNINYIHFILSFTEALKLYLCIAINKKKKIFLILFYVGAQVYNISYFSF